MPISAGAIEAQACGVRRRHWPFLTLRDDRRVRDPAYLIRRNRIAGALFMSEARFNQSESCFAIGLRPFDHRQNPPRHPHPPRQPHPQGRTPTDPHPQGW